MLPRKQRLPRYGFPQLRTLARAQSAHFSISYGESTVPGAAVIVPKKVVKSSVGRHRIKRQVLATLQPHVGSFRTIIIAVRGDAANVPSLVLRDELNSLLRSILPTR
jgi:ribonuclease P protein component